MKSFNLKISNSETSSEIEAVSTSANFVEFESMQLIKNADDDHSLIVTERLVTKPSFLQPDQYPLMVIDQASIDLLNSLIQRCPKNVNFFRWVKNDSLIINVLKALIIQQRIEILSKVPILKFLKDNAHSKIHPIKIKISQLIKKFEGNPVENLHQLKLAVDELALTLFGVPNTYDELKLARQFQKTLEENLLRLNNKKLFLNSAKKDPAISSLLNKSAKFITNAAQTALAIYDKKLRCIWIYQKELGRLFSVDLPPQKGGDKNVLADFRFSPDGSHLVFETLNPSIENNQTERHYTFVLANALSNNSWVSSFEGYKIYFVSNDFFVIKSSTNSKKLKAYDYTYQKYSEIKKPGLFF